MVCDQGVCGLDQGEATVSQVIPDCFDDQLGGERSFFLADVQNWMFLPIEDLDRSRTALRLVSEVLVWTGGRPKSGFCMIGAKHSGDIRAWKTSSVAGVHHIFSSSPFLVKSERGEATEEKLLTKCL